MAAHAAFARISSKLLNFEPPCMSEADDWESSSGFLAEEHLVKTRQSTPDRLHLERAMTSRSTEDDGLNSAMRADGLTSLRRAWESSQRSTKEDWAEWMRNFSIELLKQSPSRALKACSSLAQTNPGMARELFAAGFVSCWSELDEHMQEQLVRSLEAALASPTIPPDIVTTLLNLAEFMEHDEKALPLDTRCAQQKGSPVALSGWNYPGCCSRGLWRAARCALLPCGTEEWVGGAVGPPLHLSPSCSSPILPPSTLPSLPSPPPSGRWGLWLRSATPTPRRCTTRSWNSRPALTPRWRR